jgi:hypothetical protein
MKKRNLPRTEKIQRPRREREPIPWRQCLLALACGVILVGGFFYAARTHFSAVDFGMKNAKLRRQKEDLEAEQQRFKLAREIALSPAEVKKAARKLGFQDMSASNIQVFKRPESGGNALVEKTAYVKPKNEAAAVSGNEKTKAIKPDGRVEKEKEVIKPQAKISKNGDAAR